MDPAEPHILGQRLAVAALAKALGSGRLHHAWILHGPAGVGKFRVAEGGAEHALKTRYKEVEKRGASPALVITENLAETRRLLSLPATPA